MHLYQPGFLYLAMGQANGRWLTRDERTLLRRDVDLAVERAIRIDTDAGTVELERGGNSHGITSCSRPERVSCPIDPGLAAGSFGFYSLEDAERLREEPTVPRRPGEGGRRGHPIQVPAGSRGVRVHARRPSGGVVSATGPRSPCCPPEPRVHDRKRFEADPADHGAARDRARDVFNVEAVDPSAGIVSSIEGDEAEYDLLVLVPPHRGQELIDRSELGDPGGWLPTDRDTLQVEGHERIFAIGDATNLPISKSGSTAHFEAPVVASRIASLIREPRLAPTTAAG